MPNIIEVNQLIKRYPNSDQPVVRDVSFAVRRGEIFGLLGPTGAGKTTIIAMLACRLKPSGGAAAIAGFDLFRQPNDIKRRIGFAPQKITLIPGLSIPNNLLLYGRLHGLNSEQLRPRVAEAVQLAGFEAGCRDRMDQQSGGVQRRISFAAALLHQPEILFLDEPTAGLDQQSRNYIWAAVIELNRRGVTVVTATCNSAEAEQLCQRVALIDRGRIVALDTPRALQDISGGRLAAPENLNAVFLELTGKQLRG